MHDFYELFSRFWWLIFPLYYMVARSIRLSRRTTSQDRAMEILRIYAAKGEQPPPEVMKALTQMTSHPDDEYGTGGATDPSGGYRMAPRTGSAGSWWWTCFIFVAVTAGFAVGVNGFGPQSEAHTPFLIVTVIMAFLAVGALVMAIAASFRGRR